MVLILELAKSLLTFGNYADDLLAYAQAVEDLHYIESRWFHYAQFKKNGRHEPECIHVLGYERKPELAQTRSSTTVHYKTCRNTLQYYRIPQNLHKHVPILPYTRKLARTRSHTRVYYKTCTTTFQYHRILQNLRQHVPVLAYTCRNTLLYYRILQNWHQHVPVLPFTTKLAETRSSTTKVAQARSSTTARYKTGRNTFQYYRIPQTLHNTRFCSFPYGHRTNDAENDAKTTRKTTRKRCANQLEANKGPAPRPPDYNIREKYP